jgi:hypothetical protein
MKSKIHYVSEDGSSSVMEEEPILFTLSTMYNVQETSGSQCYVPSSKPFRFKSIYVYDINIDLCQNVHSIVVNSKVVIFVDLFVLCMMCHY